MTPFRKLLFTVGSLWFSAVLLVLALFAMACATVFESAQGTESALVEFYRSSWFQALLAIFALNILAALLARFPFSRHQIGLVLTHGGILLTLAGAIVTERIGIDGQVAIAEGEETDTFTVSRSVLTLESPDGSAPEKAQLDGRAFGGLEPADLGRRSLLATGNVVIRGLRYLPDATLQERVLEDSAGPKAMEIAFASSGKALKSWVFADRETREGSITIRLRAIPSREELDRLLAAETTGSSGSIRVEVKDEVFDLPLESSTEKAAPLGQTGYSVRVLRYLPHAVVGEDRKLANASQRPVNPAVEVEITGPAGTETRFAFAKFPDFQSMHGGTRDEAVRLRFTSSAVAGAVDSVELLEGPSGELFVRFLEEGKTVASSPLSAQKPAVTPWDGIQLSLLRTFRGARSDVVPSEVVPPRKAREPALLVAVEAPGLSQELWLKKHTPASVTIDGAIRTLAFRDDVLPLGFRLKLDHFRVGYYPGERRPRSFESHVTITDPRTGSSKGHLISMNNPLAIGGYSLFQSSYRQGEGVTMSFLSVSRDPGQLLAFLGYGATMAGMLVVLIQRMVEQRRRARIEAGLAGAQGVPVALQPLPPRGGSAGGGVPRGEPPPGGAASGTMLPVLVIVVLGAFRFAVRAEEAPPAAPAVEAPAKSQPSAAAPPAVQPPVGARVKSPQVKSPHGAAPPARSPHGASPSGASPQQPIQAVPPPPARLPSTLDMELLRRLPVQYDGRWPPLDTVARDTVEAITGTPSFRGQDPVLVFLAWTLDPRAWMAQPLVPIRNVELRSVLKLPAERTDFSFSELLGHEPLQQEIGKLDAMDDGRKPDPLESKVSDIQKKLTTLDRAFRGQVVRPVPDARDPSGAWQPVASLAREDLEAARAVSGSWDELRTAFLADDGPAFAAASRKLTESLGALPAAYRPDPKRIESELRHNAAQPFRLSWIIFAAGAALAAGAMLVRRRWFDAVAVLALLAGFVVLTWGLSGRWSIAGRIPASNMFESLLFLGWGMGAFAVVSLAFLRHRLVPLTASCMGAIALLLADVLPLDSYIRPAPPVLLDTIWMSIHVPIIMVSYSVLALAVLVAHLQIVVLAVTPRSTHLARRIDGMHAWYVHVGSILLFAGIVTGSMWAASSWGRYWGWDPKEVWSLVAFLAYMAILHVRSSRESVPRWYLAVAAALSVAVFAIVVPKLAPITPLKLLALAGSGAAMVVFVVARSEFSTAVKSILAFWLIIMTYVGVNYVLGMGLHSYGFGTGAVVRYMFLLGCVDLAFVAICAMTYRLRRPSVA